MTRTSAEILLFASLAINAALLIFIAGVLRKVMDDMDESAFRQILVSLVHRSKRSAFMLTVLNIPFFGAIPYFYYYGFGDHWLVAGLAVWLVGGSIAKAIKYPLYASVAKLSAGDVEQLRAARKKVNAGNVFHAVLNTVAAFLAFVPLCR